MKPRFLFAAAAVLGTLSTNVWAQAFLSDDRIANGRGVKAGDFELHPGVSGEFGYDSNYFQRSGDPGPTPAREDVIPALRLRITPSLSFETTGRRAREEGGGPPPSVVFNGKLSAAYNALFNTRSSDPDVKKQDGVGVNAGLGADILPDKPWGVDLNGDYARILEASNDPGVSNAFRRDTIRGGAGINWRPGGGLFQWRLGYGLVYNYFEQDGFKNLNNFQHKLETRGRWRFLPRTAILYKGELTFVNFSGPNAAASGRHDGQTLRSQIGLNGLFTNHFGFLGLVGWGASFFEGNAASPAQNFDSIIGQAELTWYPTPQPKLDSGTAPVGLSSVSLGYTRNFSVSYLGDYYQRDRGYANIAYFFAQRFVVSVAGGLSLITRPSGAGLIMPDGKELRTDALAFLEYRPGDSVGINVTLRYDAELRQVIAGQVGGVGGDDLKFDRYQAFLGLRWFL